MPAKAKSKTKTKSSKSRVSRKARLSSKPKFSALTLALITVGLVAAGYYKSRA